MKQQIIYLHVTDMSTVGGSHLYGKLMHYDWKARFGDSFTSHELWYTLDAHMAAKFNRYEPGAYKAYRPGDRSQRFESIDTLARVARAEWRELFPEGRILLLGTNSAMPRHVLDGLTEEQRCVLESIYQEGEEIGWYDHRTNFYRTEKICARWFEALRSFGIETPRMPLPSLPPQECGEEVAPDA